MTLPHAHIDEGGLQEFSVVFTDRSLNHMSARFGGAMREISTLLKQVYNAEALALIPGGGSYGMEAVARQFGQGRNLVVRNGWFSYRWTQIFEAGKFSQDVTVVMARQTGNGARALCPAACGRGLRPYPRGAPRSRVCPACGDKRRDHPAR